MNVYVGAAAWIDGKVTGAWRRRGGTGGWERMGNGLPENARVHAITVHPVDRNTVYLAAAEGLFRSRDAGDAWTRLDVPADLQYWAVHIHPADPRLIYVGTSPVGVLRSDDGGESFRLLPGSRIPQRVRMSFACRVLRIAADPANLDHVYAALEVGGVMRSLDRGETWTEHAEPLARLAREHPHLRSQLQSDTDAEGMLDAHAILVSAAKPGQPMLAVRMGIFSSADRGTTWEDAHIERFSPLTYARDLITSPHDPRVLFACLSPASRSTDGTLYRSDDAGESWTRIDRGIKPGATMMAVAADPRDPRVLHCASRCGQVFSTRDGGAHWEETHLPDGVLDVYAVASS